MLVSFLVKEVGVAGELENVRTALALQAKPDEIMCFLRHLWPIGWELDLLREDVSPLGENLVLRHAVTEWTVPVQALVIDDAKRPHVDS
jgi:hypothetical protein